MDIKPTLLLAAALFLISAPQPDSRAVAEITRNFIVPTDERALQAAELEARAEAAEPRTGEQAELEPETLPTTPAEEPQPES